LNLTIILNKISTKTKQIPLKNVIDISIDGSPIFHYFSQAIKLKYAEDLHKH